MATMKSITSALVVSAPHPLTSEQVDQVRAEITRQVPAGTAVVVVPTGFTVHSLSLAPSSVELQHDQADLFYQQLAVMKELQKLGAGIADAIEALGSVPMRVAP